MSSSRDDSDKESKSSFRKIKSRLQQSLHDDTETLSKTKERDNTESLLTLKLKETPPAPMPTPKFVFALDLDQNLIDVTFNPDDEPHTYPIAPLNKV